MQRKLSKPIGLVLGLILAMLFCACTARQQPPQGTTPPETELPAATRPEETAAPTQSTPTETEPTHELEENMSAKMHVQIGTHTFTATLEDNAAVDALVSLMAEGPVTIQMADYAGFEKVGPLGQSLPASDRQTTTQPGDIVLYNSNQIVIFYGSNSWRYTKLATIDDLSGWADALGSGDVTVTFSLA